MVPQNTTDTFSFFTTCVMSAKGEQHILDLCKQGQAASPGGPFETVGDYAMAAAQSNRHSISLYQFFTSLATVEHTDPNHGHTFTMSKHIFALFETLNQYNDMVTRSADREQTLAQVATSDSTYLLTSKKIERLQKQVEKRKAKAEKAAQKLKKAKDALRLLKWEEYKKEKEQAPSRNSESRESYFGSY
ncbi:MAG: hypothetical protein Q9157_002042 [Trypethelium eluteriae]